jgi:hypothetical protein
MLHFACRRQLHLSGPPTYFGRSFLRILPLVAGVLLSPGCGKADPRFVSPAATFKTYKQALAERDMQLLWSCYSQNYKTIAAPDYSTWINQWEQKTPSQLKAEQDREITDEHLINDKIAYLLFDATTLESRQTSPFFYFIHDADGWKITSHLDSTFQRELEQAIEHGEFKLPDR